MKFADYRQFERDRQAAAEPSKEDVQKAHADLHAIVGRMRGEYQGDAPRSSEAEPPGAAGRGHSPARRQIGHNM
jgi:hypothetical protein